MADTLSERVRGLVESLPQPLADGVAVSAELALHLAARIDAGVDDRYVASVVRELRAIVVDLEAGGVRNDAFAELARQLSAEVVDAEN